MNSVSFGICLIFLLRAECARILGVFPAPGYSQYILAEVLMSEVAKRGHEVTVISPYEPKNKLSNFKTILNKEVIDGAHSDLDLYGLASASFFTNIKTTYLYGNAITVQTFTNKEVQQLIQSNEEFDLVIVEQFFNDAMKGFAAHFKAPLILFNSMGVTEWNKEYMGIPMLPSVTAVTYTSYTNSMGFFQRIKNIVGTVYDYIYRNFVFYPQQEKFLAEYFPEPMDFYEIINNASLMLLNSHATTSENVLLPYNAIEIGGFHVVQNPLNKDVQKYLDDAKDGAILFSLGSNLRVADLPEETINGIFKTFSKLKQRVLWKFEKDLPNKPENVFISKWFSQRDILAHPNLKLFITHGGLLSVTESIFHGVPMVGIPVFADQQMNMARAKSNGVANIIPFLELAEEKFAWAVNETLNNPKYQSNAEKLSSLMKDRIVKPIDEGMYWIEYVIRHKGARFDTASFKLTWFQFYMFDILSFVLFNVLVLYVCVFMFVKCLKNVWMQRECRQKTKRKRQ